MQPQLFEGASKSSPNAIEGVQEATFNRLAHIQGLLVKLQDPATLAATSLAMTGRRKPAHFGGHSASMLSLAVSLMGSVLSCHRLDQVQ